ncbi:testis-expressed sequence 2 protein-like [Senna tora]|uniref:Testis-expressed sequence 2 protein-like n=1 Tax=Senna tora TaxID=362788 RepID=A0A834TMW3_9FABA|nr:testis-expressed sequence 2 protein-like [Senna tora]
MVLVLILFGFILGVVAVVAAEALGVFFIVRWLGAKTKSRAAKTSLERHASAVELDPQQSLSFAENKQGVVWVLESDKIPEISLDKPSKETKRRKPEIFGVLPVKKLFFYAKSNTQLKRFIQARIQVKSSVQASTFNTGTLPPCIVGMRVLPMEMSEPMALEQEFYQIKIVKMKRMMML